MYEYSIPEKTGIIKNFDLLTRPALERMKQDLGLKIPVSTLYAITQQYKTFGKQPPNVSEICFLDAWFDAISKLPENTVITDFQTADKRIADTYAEFLKMNSEIKLNSCPSVTDLFSTADKWLEKTCKRFPDMPQGQFFYASPNSAVVEIAHGFARLQSAEFESGSHGAAAYTVARRNERKEGSDLILLLPGDDCTDSEFADFTESIFASDSIKDCINDIRPLGLGGITYAVTDMTNGAYLTVEELPERSGGGHFAADITTMFERGAVLACAPSTYGKIAEAASGTSVKAYRFGTSNASGIIAVMLGPSLLSALDLRILKSVILKTEKTVSVEPEDGIINNCPSAVFDEGQNSKIGGFLCGSADTECKTLPFTGTYYAVCTSYLRAIAAGSAYGSVFASCSAELPDPDKDFSNAVAAALGAFRAQNDLVLRVNGIDLTRKSDECPHFAAFSAGASDKDPIPSSFTGIGKNVCLMTPRIGENKLPNADDLKGLAKYLSDLIKEGKITSAYAFCGLGIDDALREMSAEFDCEIDMLTDRSRLIPIGVIVETESPINAEFVGKTAFGKTASEVRTVSRPEYMSPVYRKTPTAAVCSDKPEAIVRMFSAAGAECKTHCCTDSRKSIGEFSANMLNGDIAVFDASLEFTETLIGNPRILHAISEYRTSGRLILAVGESAAAFAKHGYTETPLDAEASEVPASGKIILENANSPMLTFVPAEKAFSGGKCLLRASRPEGVSAFTDSGYVAYSASKDGLILCAPLGCTKEIAKSAVAYFA